MVRLRAGERDLSGRRASSNKISLYTSKEAYVTTGRKVVKRKRMSIGEFDCLE